MVVLYPGEVVVESGDVISELSAGATEPDLAIYVLSGGTVVNTGVFNEGQLIVDSGAVAIGTYVSLGMCRTTAVCSATPSPSVVTWR
jgi:hypothetical protein